MYKWQVRRPGVGIGPWQAACHHGRRSFARHLPLRFVAVEKGRGAATARGGQVREGGPSNAKEVARRRRSKRSSVRSLKRSLLLLKEGVKLSCGSVAAIRDDPGLLCGWDVLLAGDLRAKPGTVRAVEGGPAPLLRVHGPGWGIPEGLEPVFKDKDSEYLIPFADGILQRVAVESKRIVVQPPEGLLQLGHRPILLRWLEPQLERLSKEFCSDRSGMRPKMPSRKQLESSGNGLLVQAIMHAGGFLEVACALNLRTARKPSGYWDNLDTLDQEISGFVAANWVALPGVDLESTYYYNEVSGRASETEPQLPTMTQRGDGWVIEEDERDRVMPLVREVMAAGRYDLHHAICRNGGYRAVAVDLQRTPSNNVRPTTFHELVTELQVVMEEEELGDKLPSIGLLMNTCRAPLIRSVHEMGGPTTVAERMSKELGITVRVRRKRYWEDMDNVVAELRAYIEQREKALGEKLERLPTHRELMACGRSDLRYALQKHGGRSVAAAIGLKCDPRGNRDSALAQRNRYWEDMNNVVAELRAYIEERENALGVKVERLPTHRELVACGRSDLRYALRKHGGRSVAAALGLKCDQRGTRGKAAARHS